MSQDLWTQTLGAFTDAIATPDPTPGGGSVASVTATMGANLVVMALEVSAKRARTKGLDEAADQLDLAIPRGQSLAGLIRSGARADIVAFDTLMAAYRLAKDDPGRPQALADATLGATEAPVTLINQIAAAVDFATGIAPLVAPSIISDVHAGVAILVGGAEAARTTADINLPTLAPDVRNDFEERLAVSEQNIRDSRARLHQFAESSRGSQSGQADARTAQR